MINYFPPVSTPEESCVRRIKGNYRRQFVSKFIESGQRDSIPPAWMEHEISEFLKGILQSQHPQARGGEDLPDLEDHEVEIARLTLANSVHGEVTSLRARKEPGEDLIHFRIVDEYKTSIGIPHESASTSLTAEQVIECFRDAEPSQTETECEIEFQSYLYPDLNDVAAHLGVM